MTVTVDEFEVADPADAWTRAGFSVDSGTGHGHGAAGTPDHHAAASRTRDVGRDGDDLGARESLSQQLDHSAYPRRMAEHADVVIIHTDGGCRPNPGPGGWGAVLRQREHVREMFGGESGDTSNNRMELTAPIMALEALTRPVVVHLYTDSTYVRSGITKWVLGWERNGWMTSAKQPVKNVDLWKRLQTACARHQVEWFWVKGHSGVADNELADVLATQGMQQAIAASG